MGSDRSSQEPVSSRKESGSSGKLDDYEQLYYLRIVNSMNSGNFSVRRLEAEVDQ